MKAALLYGVKDLRVVDAPRPALAPDGVLVRVTACGLCPTDLRKYHTGDNGTLKLPMNLGHEWVGVVEEVGPLAAGFHVGQRVIGDTYDGYAEIAPITGATIRLSFPHGPVQIPAHVPDDELTFAEPLADCLHTVIDQAKVQPGETVVVCGAGQMGLQMISVAKLYGGMVIVSEPDEMRRDLARAFGADHVIDPSREEPAARVHALTGGQGAEAVILAIGIPSLVQQGLDMAAHRGRVVLFAGFQKPARAEIDPNVIHYKEIVLTGSEWIGVEPHVHPERYQQAVDLMAAGQVPLRRLISATFPLSRINEAFSVATDRQKMKVIVRIQEEEGQA